MEDRCPAVLYQYDFTGGPKPETYSIRIYNQLAALMVVTSPVARALFRATAESTTRANRIKTVLLIASSLVLMYELHYIQSPGSINMPPDSCADRHPAPADLIPGIDSIVQATAFGCGQSLSKSSGEKGSFRLYRFALAAAKGLN